MICIYQCKLSSGLSHTCKVNTVLTALNCKDFLGQDIGIYRYRQIGNYWHSYININTLTMNKVLYVARKAKGFTEKQVAKALQIEESAYRELEASLTDVTATIALRAAKLFDIDAELFIYTEGREQRLVKFAMDEIANFKQSGILNDLPPQHLFHIVNLGNTALSLQVELNHCVFRQYELERDNEALRQLNAELKAMVKLF